jgi:hypothetical protein
LWRQNYSRVNTDYVFTGLNNRFPPLPTNVFLELYAQWAIIPGRSGSTVNFTTWENKTPTFGQIYYSVYAIHETQHPIRLSDWLPEAGNPILSRETGPIGIQVTM